MSPGKPGGFFGGIAAAVARRAWPSLFIGALFAIAAVVGIAVAGIKVQPVTDAIFDTGSKAYVDTTEAEKDFGGEPVVIQVKGNLRETLKAENLEQLSKLELCVTGQIKRGRGELFDICDRIAEIDPVAVAAGPATFLGRAVAGLTNVYEQEMNRLEGLPEGSKRAKRANQEILALGAEIISRYGISSFPSLEDPTFISRVVFRRDEKGAEPKSKLSYLFPSSDSAQVVLRLRSDLTDEERSETISLIKKAAADPATQIKGGEYVVTGSPVVFDGLEDSLRTGVVILAVVALVLMAATLAVIFGSIWRLMPLALGVGAILIAAGLLRLLGGSVSLAALGALPILIGLTVDYAVQIQARYDEQDHAMDPADAARAAASLGVPMIAVACVASALGFGSLLVSPVPLISEFGILLGAGVLVCLAVVFPIGFAALAIRGPGLPADMAIERLAVFGRVRDGAKSLLGMAILAPGRLLAVSIVIAACGWVAGTQADTATEVRQLLPTRTEAVQDLIQFEDSTGSSGEVDVIVRADDVTDPKVVKWMTDLRTSILARAGYAPVDPICSDAQLCPAPAISDFVPSGAEGMTAREVRHTLRGLPPDERRAIVVGGLSGKEQPTVTKIPFVVREGSVDRQQQVIAMIEDEIADSNGGKGPPAGVTAELAGLPVVVASTVDDLAASRYMLIGLAILAVALVLLIAYRSLWRVLTPLIPIVVAGGWSAMIVSSLDLSLNPLSAVLTVLVIAISTEFSVILSGRYFQEREGGRGMAEALRFTYGRTGMAVAASGLTAIAGFAALAASDIQMLRDFGLVAVIDLSVALLGVAIVLPAVLAWRERR